MHVTMLQVVVMRAKDLPKSDVIGSSDPLVEMTTDGACVCACVHTIVHAFGQGSRFHIALAAFYY